MRLVSQQTSRILDANRNTPANFGLIFNKWLDFKEVRGTVKPVAQENKQLLIDKYKKSSREVAALLKNRHLAQMSYCAAMGKNGWRSFIFEAELVSPFVSGLGMTHPTETGMVLDHTTGVPYIPAASQKGVMRLAHIINALRDDDGKWQVMESLLAAGIVEKKINKKSGEEEICWQEDDASKTLFGFSGNNNSLAGQIVVLDAYPLSVPELDEEILNPHFMEYYNGKRGPTEDQSPIPIKFLVVKPGARFVFRLLLRRQLANALEADQDKLASLLEKNIHRAITEEGMGAKTALGFGRFKHIATGEPKTVRDWQEDEEIKKYPWRPQVQKIKAVSDWGQLKQRMEHVDTLAYQVQPEIGQAVKEAASIVRKGNLKRWPTERDKLVEEWLIPSGTAWEHLAAVTEPMPASLTPEEQDAVERIEKLTNWGAWKNARIVLEPLPLPVLKKLREKFKKWGCDGKKAKKDKKTAWKSVNLSLKQK